MGLLNSDSLLDLLVKQKVLTVKQRHYVVLQKGKQRQKLLRAHGGRRQGESQKVGKGFPDLVDIIVSLNLKAPGKKNTLLTEEIIMRAVSRAMHIPFKKLDPLELDIEIVTKTISRSFAVNHLILPFEMHDGILDVVTYHPDNQGVLEDIERANQVKVRPHLGTRSDIKKILAEFFGFQHSISAAESQYTTPGTGSTVDVGNLEQYVKLSSGQELSSSDQHIKSAVNHLFQYALEQRASDIHVEPKRDVCLIRYRIDGVLHTIYKLPKAVHAAITSRIKALARLDIAEKRRPQDGRIKLATSKRELEVRVSTVLTAFGEKTVCRVQDPDLLFMDLDKNHPGFDVAGRLKKQIYRLGKLTKKLNHITRYETVENPDVIKLFDIEKSTAE